MPFSPSSRSMAAARPPGRRIRRSGGRCSGLVIALILAGWLGSALAAGGFVAGLEDVPLVPGFVTVPDSTTVFDKPAGRIVESYASGTGSAEAVRAFYDRALLQLGWQRLRADRFARDGEMLTIEIIGHDGRLTVRYALAPQP